MLRRWGPAEAGPDGTSSSSPSLERSSTGTSTRTSSCFFDPASTIVTGRGRHFLPAGCPPPSRRATSSSGRWVAERPMRWSSRRACCWRRSSERNRWAPRLVGTSEWISSTMTVSTGRRISRACEVSSRYSDSGVVIRISGGVRSICARSLAGVSPVRMPAWGTCRAPPCAAIPARGALRLRSTSTAKALSGETYKTRQRSFFAGGSVNISRSMAVRKAASVFPDPVGASRRVDSPERIGGQPRACARVGAGNDASNHRWTGGWKAADFGNESAPRASIGTREMDPAS